MAPTVAHAPGAAVADDILAQRPVTVDAATYYNGGEAYARSRTYSHVSSPFYVVPAVVNA